MFATILVIIQLVLAAFGRPAVEELFSPDELDEMGIRLGEVCAGS